MFLFPSACRHHHDLCLHMKAVLLLIGSITCTGVLRFSITHPGCTCFRGLRRLRLTLAWFRAFGRMLWLSMRECRGLNDSPSPRMYPFFTLSGCVFVRERGDDVGRKEKSRALSRWCCHFQPSSFTTTVGTVGEDGRLAPDLGAFSIFFGTACIRSQQARFVHIHTTCLACANG